MNDIDQIKIILEKIRTNDDMINIPSKDEWTKMINQDGYDIETAISNSERILKEKYAKYTDDKAFFEDCLYEYASKVIPLIKKDYAPYLNEEAIKRLDSIVADHKIIVRSFDEMPVTKRGRNPSSGYAHSDGSIELQAPKNNVISETRRQLDILLHEIFHQTHRWRVGADLNYIIDGVLCSKNMSGFMVEEGLVDKCAIDFAKKHGLSCQPNYSYNLYMNLVDKIEKSLNMSNGELFNTDYRQVLNKIDKTGELLKCYEFTELSRYTSLFQKTKTNTVTFEYDGRTYASEYVLSPQERIKQQHQEENEIAPTKTANDKIAKIQERKALLSQYAVILQEIKRRKELEDNSLSKGTQTKSRGVIDTFTCILFTLAISILTFTITYFLLSKHL